MKIKRLLQAQIEDSLKNFPVVAILGARQVGKTTIAKEIARGIKGKSVYLDLENPADLAKLNEPSLYLRENADKLVIIDEVQLMPEIFPLLRSLVDENRTNGKFLLLGSSSPDLVNKSSESLAGRIKYIELSPFSLAEIGYKKMDMLWLRGGFPDAFLSGSNDAAFDWIAHFIKTFLERDLNMMGFRLSPTNMRRLWTMIAHYHSSTINYSSLGKSLEVTNKTIKHWIDVLSDTFMLRQIQPWSGNASKRLVKSPKIYLRDSGILHSLLRIESKESLLSNPILGASWEGFVIEQIIAHSPSRSNYSFYRTQTGDEIDLLVETPTKGTIAFEIKRSDSPKLEKGFYSALETIAPHKAYVVYAGNETYRLNENVVALPLSELGKVFMS